MSRISVHIESCPGYHIYFAIDHTDVESPPSRLAFRQSNYGYFQDRGDHYMLTAEMPGFEKKDVEVKIDSNTLELKAEKSADNETKSKEGTMTQRSR